MPIVAIHDSSILIDLIRIQLMDQCLQLPYTFGTTRFVFQEINEDQKQILQPYIGNQNFLIFTFSEQELIELFREQLEDNRLSEVDWSVLYCARKQAGILLTGDNILRRKAAEKQVDVHGILWIFDQLLIHGQLTYQQAIIRLQELRIVNSRLPNQACEERIREWEAKS